MPQQIGALIGALFFILAYAYYTVAGLYSWPGGDGGMVLIEFGTVIGLVILLAMVLGACLAPPTPAPAAKPEPAQPEKPARE